jgi:hypothetical protein
MSRSPIVDALRGPSTELRETHISWVLLGPEEVVKLKKPVDFGFLDFSTLEKRRSACEAEVALNRRLAPDVYRGIAPVTREGDRFTLNGDGEIVDHAVVMQRLPDEDRADHRLARGELRDAHLRQAAETLAQFHAEAASGPEIAARGEAAAVRVSVRENFAQTRTCLPRLLGPEEALELERWQEGFLEREASRFHARAESGRVRDGHGDLRLEHLYFDPQDELRILDCIEFSDRLRHVDVVCDIAFLAMDLGVKGRVDLAERFLALYAESARDHDLYGLVDFYESYRAFVRGKIACFALEDPELDIEAREAKEAEARRFFRLALASERRSLLPPTLVGVGGIIGTGKSTMADAISRATGAPVIGSDRVRKALMGVGPRERLGDDAYTDAMTDAVYAELFRRARVVLESGRSAIVDASFASRGRRRALADTAKRAGVPLRFVECRADPRVLRRRLERRAEAGGSVSDAGPELLERFAAGFEPIDELGPAAHRVVDTDETSPWALARSLEGFIPLWPRAAPGPGR